MIREIFSGMMILVAGSIQAQFVGPGGYQGGNYGSGGDETLDVIVNDVKFLLTGNHDGFGMNSDLNDLDLLPLSQPYDTLTDALWYYTGTESVLSIPNDSVIDWVLLELRETTGEAASAGTTTMIARQAAFLERDGSVKALDGINLVRFKHLVVANNLYCVIWHRNHLPVMNRFALAMDNEVYELDLRTDSSKVYRDPLIMNPPLASLGNGKFGLWAGNAIPDNRVKYGSGADSDAGQIRNRVGTASISTVLTGYMPEDLNLDGTTRYTGKGSDRVVVWKNSRLQPVSMIIYSHIP